MDIVLLNSNLEAIYILDSYETFIWTDRYCECGDFELHSRAYPGLVDLSYGDSDYFLQIRESEHIMVLEKFVIKSDVEEGDTITLSGRSLESILDRRIVWGQRIISGKLQDGVKQLLELCIINPEDPARKIDNFIFKESEDPAITELTIEAQYTGDNLYDVIVAICKGNDLGFRLTFTDERQFVFELYSGLDRSYSQETNSYVVFSPKFDNLMNSDYIKSRSTLKNVTLVGGEGEGAERKYSTVGSATGLNRRELFTDARDISSQTDDAFLSEADYDSQLQQRGTEKLAEAIAVESFEGEVDNTGLYRYGEDFYTGDIVQMINEYGHGTPARILEMVISESGDGKSTYPTLSAITPKGE